MFDHAVQRRNKILGCDVCEGGGRNKDHYGGRNVHFRGLGVDDSRVCHGKNRKLRSRKWLAVLALYSGVCVDEQVIVRVELEEQIGKVTRYYS